MRVPRAIHALTLCLIAGLLTAAAPVRAETTQVLTLTGIAAWR